MRRLISLLAAVMVVAAPLATAGAAMAKDHRDDHPAQRVARSEARGPPPRQPPPQAYRSAPEYRGSGDGRFERAEPRGDPRGDYRSDPRYDQRAYGAPPGGYAAAPRRGGYLGPGAGGQVIQDYGRFRLRPPPRGYAWVRTPGGMALISQSTGQVFDVVPY